MRERGGDLNRKKREKHGPGEEEKNRLERWKI